MGDNVYGMGVVGNKSLLCDEYFSFFCWGWASWGGGAFFAIFGLYSCKVWCFLYILALAKLSPSRFISILIDWTEIALTVIISNHPW